MESDCVVAINLSNGRQERSRKMRVLMFDRRVQPEESRRFFSPLPLAHKLDFYRATCVLIYSARGSRGWSRQLSADQPLDTRQSRTYHYRPRAARVVVHIFPRVVAPLFTTVIVSSRVVDLRHTPRSYFIQISLFFFLL